jgi:hypothetical protein
MLSCHRHLQRGLPLRRSSNGCRARRPRQIRRRSSRDAPALRLHAARRTTGSPQCRPPGLGLWPARPGTRIYGFGCDHRSRWEDRGAVRLPRFYALMGWKFLASPTLLSVSWLWVRSYSLAAPGNDPKQDRERAVSEPSGESLRMFSWLVFQTPGAPVLFVL